MDKMWDVAELSLFSLRYALFHVPNVQPKTLTYLGLDNKGRNSSSVVTSWSRAWSLQCPSKQLRVDDFHFLLHFKLIIRLVSRRTTAAFYKIELHFIAWLKSHFPLSNHFGWIEFKITRRISKTGTPSQSQPKNPLQELKIFEFSFIDEVQS